MRPLHTSRSTAFPAVLLGVVLGALASLACSTPSRPPAPDASGSPLALTCTSPPRVRDEASCRVVTVHGRTYRFGLARATPPTRQTVVVDPGGPGMSALARDGVQVFAASHAGRFASTYNVLLLEEPWVTAPKVPTCDMATMEFYRSVRSGRPDAAAAQRVQRDCGLGAAGTYGFSASNYPALLAQIAQQESLTYEGFVGASFGSVRLRYATRAGLAFRWAVLLRPYPVAASMSEILAARSAAVDAALPVSALPVRRELTEPSPWPADIAAARAGSGHVAQPPRSATDVIERARGMWQVYGADRVSLSLLAYFDEVCRLSPPDTATWDGTASDVRGFLASFHAPCVGLPAESAPTMPTTGQRQPDLCVVSSDGDTITPARLVRASFRADATWWVGSREASHTSLDGLARCQQHIAARR